MRFWKTRRRGGLLTLVVTMVSLALIAAACFPARFHTAMPLEFQSCFIFPFDCENAPAFESTSRPFSELGESQNTP